jgi:hypothetical protein
MRRNFWKDLYPISETRRRFARSTAVWIYLPIGIGALIAIAAAVAVIGGVPGSGLNQWAQAATIVLAGVLLGAGFAIWLLLVAAIGGLEDLMAVMPFFTSRLRLRVVTGARWWNRTLNEIRRSIISVTGFFSPAEKVETAPWQLRMPKIPRGGKSNE